MNGDDVLFTKPLREQVYDYLKRKMNEREIVPGTSINLRKMSSQLGISKTPLRDALLQLEGEGFVTILPRRGIVVNELSQRDIKDFYEIIGALESSTVRIAASLITPGVLAEPASINDAMDTAWRRGNAEEYNDLNTEFHCTLPRLSGNRHLLRLLSNYRRRLYDFMPRRDELIHDWEVRSMAEHREFVFLLEEGKCEEAASLLQNVHWSFALQDQFIRVYYFEAEETKSSSA